MFSETSDKPDPRGVSTVAEFKQALRQLRLWAGSPSLRELGRPSRTGVAASTLSDAFNDNEALPRIEVVRSLLHELEAPPHHDAWLAAWRRAKSRSNLPHTRATHVPHLLPRADRLFVGRRQFLSDLDDLLIAARKNREPALALISAAGGMGKTALATHWAVAISHLFPDGQLFIDLQGFGLAGPLSAEDAAGLFLRSLGVAPGEIPFASTARLALYRSIVADRSILVVLDNASDLEQVRPLLPAGKASAGIVTTRHAFAGLVAREGAVRIALTPLSQDESHELLSRLGAATTALSEHLAHVHKVCAGLPLALRVAGQVITGDQPPNLEPTDELERAGLRLLALPDDPQSDIRSVLSWSLHRLDRSTSRLFRLLGLHPGAHFHIGCAAALLGAQPGDVQSCLEHLLDAALIDEISGDRYAMHDLLRSYAAELSNELGSDDIGSATDRLLDFYVHSTFTANFSVHPWDAPETSNLPGSSELAMRFPDGSQADMWLDAELDNLVAVAQQATALGYQKHASQLSGILWRRLIHQARYQEALTIHEAAYDSAHSAVDHVDAGAAAFRVADMLWRVGDYGGALTWFSVAREHKTAAGDRLGLAHVCTGLGAAHELSGDLEQARVNYEAGLELARAVASTDTEAIALYNLGNISRLESDLPQAESLLQQSAALAEKHNYRDQLFVTLLALAEVSAFRGRLHLANQHLKHAARLAHEMKSDAVMAELYQCRGVILAVEGRRAEAMGSLNQAEQIFRRLGHAAGVQLVASEIAKLQT